MIGSPMPSWVPRVTDNELSRVETHLPIIAASYNNLHPLFSDNVTGRFLSKKSSGRTRGQDDVLIVAGH